MNSTQLQKLTDMLTPISMNLSKYSHGLNQSLCESFNHVISTYAPKNNFVPLMYQPRVYLAVLVSNWGVEQTISEVLKEIDVIPSPELRAFLAQKQKQRNYNATRYQNVEKARRKRRSTLTRKQPPASARKLAVEGAAV